MRLEAADQFEVAMTDRNRGDQVREPGEVRLALQRAALLQDRAWLETRFSSATVTSNYVQALEQLTDSAAYSGLLEPRRP